MRIAALAISLLLAAPAVGLAQSSGAPHTGGSNTNGVGQKANSGREESTGRTNASGGVAAKAPQLWDLSPEGVREVQQSLRRAKLYAGPIDGVPGRDLRIALHRFKQQNRLPVNDLVDEAVAKKLGADVTEIVPVRGVENIPRDPGIAFAQKRLQELGYWKGQADGRRSADFEDALARYQKDKGLQVTGELDRGTSESLGLGAGSQGGRGAPEPAGTPSR